MKILVICSTLDLRYRLGCTPSWWQLLKAFYETGNEVIAIPFLGEPIESLWWRTYPNPCSHESKLFNYFLEFKKRRGISQNETKKQSTLISNSLNAYIKGKWEKHLLSILEKEKDVDFVLFMNVPLNFIRGIPTEIQNNFGIPVAFYDGDMPTILPKYAIDRGFKFNYYLDADLSEFNAFFSNSKGVIPELEKMGAKNVHPLYYAADPELFKPIDIEKEIDVSFFGYGDSFREEWMTNMIAKPSLASNSIQFFVAGGGFSINLDNANFIGDLSFCEYRKFCCSSKVCLNITRWSHTSVYASSTARPFELAAFGACIVSQPYNGIEEWFEPGKELIIVDEETNLIDLYQELVDSEEKCEEMGINAREKVLKDHTYRKRVDQLLTVIKGRAI